MNVYLVLVLQSKPSFVDYIIGMYSHFTNSSKIFRLLCLMLRLNGIPALQVKAVFAPMRTALYYLNRNVRLIFAPLCKWPGIISFHFECDSCYAAHYLESPAD